MSRWIKNLTRILVLPLFIMYALSPIYMTGEIGEDPRASLELSQKDVTFGVVWVQFLVEAMIEEERIPGPLPGSPALESQPDDEMVLIKKKRILLRENYKLQPVFQVVMAEETIEDSTLFLSSTYDIPRDLIHNHADGYYSLSTGLSPPSFRS
jgi:hypothetical protein